MPLSYSLPTLNTELHDLDPALFGSPSQLRCAAPNAEGWSAVMVTCSEFGFRPDDNSAVAPGQLYLIQNFGNVLPVSPSSPDTQSLAHQVIRGGIRDVIVLGHIGCRFVRSSLCDDRDSEPRDSETQVGSQANRLSQFMATHYGHRDVQRDHQELAAIAAQEHVLMQLENVVRSLQDADVTLRLHAWMGGVHPNRLWRFDPHSAQFDTCLG